jgi:hypothetical protein
LLSCSAAIIGFHLSSNVWYSFPIISFRLLLKSIADVDGVVVATSCDGRSGGGVGGVGGSALSMVDIDVVNFAVRAGGTGVIFSLFFVFSFFGVLYKILRVLVAERGFIRLCCR